MDTIRFPDGSAMSFCQGPQAACLAPQIWAGLQDRHRDMLFWDCPPSSRAAWFSKVLRLAGLCAVGWQDGRCLGAAWTVPFAQGARSALLHMAFAGAREQADACGSAFLKRVQEEGRLDSLCGIVPWPFRHMRRYAESFGFRSVCRIPGACWLPGHGGRVADADFLLWEARHG